MNFGTNIVNAATIKAMWSAYSPMTCPTPSFLDRMLYSGVTIWSTSCSVIAHIVIPSLAAMICDVVSSNTFNCVASPIDALAFFLLAAAARDLRFRSAAFLRCSSFLTSSGDFSPFGTSTITSLGDFSSWVVPPALPLPRLLVLLVLVLSVFGSVPPLAVSVD